MILKKITDSLIFVYILGKDKTGKPDTHYHHIHIQGLKFNQIINKEK